MFFFENYFSSKRFYGYAENEFDNFVKRHVPEGRKLSAQRPKLMKKYNSLNKNCFQWKCSYGYVEVSFERSNEKF